MADLPPIWLLDVDGVLNARRPAWSEAPFNGTAFVRTDVDTAAAAPEGSAA